MTKYVLICLTFCIFHINSTAQLNFINEGVMEGYTLFDASRPYLVDNCGQVVNSWSGVNPHYHTKLLPNGNIVFIQFFTNRIIEKDWDDNIVNDVEIVEPGIELNYEVIVLDNGNYLCVARKSFSESDFS